MPNPASNQPVNGQPLTGPVEAIETRIKTAEIILENPKHSNYALAKELLPLYKKARTILIKQGFTS